jgi:benzoylformate decarboxylase
MVVGAGVTDERSWAAVIALAERLGCPVWQEAFSGGAGFPQDHPQFAGHLPAGRRAVRETLRGRDTVLVVGGAAFKQYLYEPGPLVNPGTRVAVITSQPAEALRSAAELVVLAPIAHACELLADAVTRRPVEPIADWRRAAPSPGGPLRAGHVIDGLAQRLSADTIVIEEAPSSRSELIDRIVVREPRGFISTAMGGLGFAMPAAVGLRLAEPRRPVVAIVGDGSAIYCVQALWSAAHYGVGAVFVVLSNGGYEIMDRLAQASGLDAPWPGFGSLDVAAIASGFGCETVSITTHDELTTTLDDVLASLPERTSPLLIDVAVVRDET